MIQAAIDDVNRSALIFALAPDETNASLTQQKSWADEEFGGNDPQLTINQDVQHFALGDFDENGSVGLEDFVIMKNNWASIGNLFNTNGEVTGDGVVTVADYALFKNQLFPGGAEAFALAIATPEPSTLVLILAAIPMCLGTRSRRRRT